MRRPFPILALFLLPTVAGCYAAVDETHVTKEEARAAGGRSDLGADLCEIEGWYGDGVCDDFCLRSDPDCATCAALPSCMVGETQYDTWEECPLDDASCREVTECGVTIWCSDSATCAAVPTCDAGETEHARWEDCPADASCREVTECGATIWCSSGCAPSCTVGEVEHSRWEDCPADASCREVTACEQTIWCSDTATCAGVPTCDPGETAHARASDCPADGGCREVTECGATIWCSGGPVDCAGPNPAGCVSTGCEPGYHCDTSIGSAPSACTCDVKTASWTCTADVSGGVCVAD